MTRLEVGQGQKRHVGEGALIGSLVGIPIGIAIATAATPKEKECGGGLGNEKNHQTCITQGGIAGFFGGMLVGALIGSAIRGDRWKEVPLDRVRVSLGPQRDGRFGFGASVRF